MCNSCTNVLPEQQEWNGMKKQQNTEEESKKRRANMEKYNGQEKRSPDGLTVDRAYRPSGVAIPLKSEWITQLS